ncbi:MAG: CHRD domain-containing protein [Phycisphaerae bacterium]|nr:CHRD domain-containing protein [Phycisphaerae bacterium]
MKKFVTASLAVAAFAGIASARPMFHYEFPLSGLEEVPANASPGVGFAIVDLNTDTNMLSWTITYSGLVAPVTASHFHQAAPGVNGPVVVNVGALPSPIIGSAAITDAFETAILAGNAYYNLHTSAFPGGEIRGQVVPTPGALALVGLGGLVAARRRRD